MRSFCRLTLLLALAGCSCATTPGALYLERLAGALDQPIPPLQPNAMSLTLMPLGSELAIARPAVKFGVLDIAELHRCKLGPLVGARNGALGRVQGASQRFIYDVALINGLRQCADPSDALDALLGQRTTELGVSVFNALFAGKEWHAFATPPPLDSTMSIDRVGVQHALLSLRDLIEQPLGNAQVERIEQHLGVLLFSRALGQQREAWRRQSLLLERATIMLRRARAKNPGCRTGKPTPAGRIRLRVFETYYVAGIQGELAAQGQPDRGWLLSLRHLIELVVRGVEGTASGARIARLQAAILGSQPTQEFGRWRAALAAHTEAWQWQLRACGLMPTALRTTAE